MAEHAKWLDEQGQYEGAGCWFHEMSALYLRQESVTRERKQVVGKNAEILKCALAACQRAATTTQTNMRQISIYLGLAVTIVPVIIIYLFLSLPPSIGL